jgi:transcriptional regulator with XRE-family HTH domain
MNPQEAVAKLRARGWSIIQIAKFIGMNRTNLYKVEAGQNPRYAHGDALVKLARGNKMPPKGFA